MTPRPHAIKPVKAKRSAPVKPHAIPPLRPAFHNDPVKADKPNGRPSLRPPFYWLGKQTTTDFNESELIKG